MGTAVHTIIEHFIATGEVLKFEDVFFPLVREQRKIEPDTTQWLAGGPKDAPFMGQKVVDMGKQCVENALTFLDDMEVWEVEYELLINLPGLEVPVKMFIDIVGEHKKHGPLVPDWKSSADKPKNNLQLETYGAGLKIGGAYRDIDFKGYWAMLRPGAKPKTDRARLVEFQMTPEELGARYQRAYEKMKAKEYPALATFCDFCTQKPNCLVQSGPTARATFYDKSETDGIPF